ncbi:MULTISPECIES: DEAD/DEAH box helicase family protein [unclassified Kaistella]|uniref:type I restriction endonuclease subunit R n=1 Tax=unclassified Kaistella TaxID=2762626 RepID=UPI0027369C07|nr:MULTISPECIES: DEAD/DEAH box helicase family protein [unclassified Kaistella]MDP2455077.1 type I restriction-modification enzyme R subunit C-terminal domain-containing protein [Kaistella sp. SH11-4b]MDP2457985.1 type I restriction-modification enzyme R subunit C-terminal domain-containing protein [Kaistella sp. SH40-3]MDP2460871.1 type I restriction-modification enzyme R subunit C-terminal domain-containing protein [Kaistella sp. SH19-2b]
MTENINQNPEQIARDKIDQMLREADWIVQSKTEVDLSAGRGVALRETNTVSGSADYKLFVDRVPVGVIEAKKEDEGHRLTVVEEQSKRYATEPIKIGAFTLENDKPFVYESTGTITRFTDYRDPKPRSRTVFSFHKPETIAEWLKKGKSVRERLLALPPLDPTGLRPAQIIAINNLEHSFKKNKPKALIQMATGAGKTFTAATFVYRLLKHADAKRILFLVDTKNLGEQAEQEFMTFKPNDDNRKFTELYNVQRLSSSYIASDSQVCISTIQRLYAILKGEELDEGAEEDNPNENSWLQKKIAEKKAVPVEYTPRVPIEQFDFIVIDEAHRSIYNLWKQVLDYFDAFLIGLTATPDKRTFGFFNENVVSQYTYEESVTDGVNVPYDVYTIETEISKNGETIKAGWFVDRRDKLTRKKRWLQEDEDTEYKSNDLDKKVVNPSQIRNIIKEYKKALQATIFPNRIDENGDYEVPKTLVFAKTDSHADDIIQIIREEFDEGNDFCKKVTYKAEEDPKSVLNRFRNSYYPRIAVTVDMIATGTDVKPLEVLLFMRDVRSVNYFEQMKGRGTRTINSDTLQLVSKTAKTKTHFVIVDAVGVTKSKKTDSRPLERKPTVPMTDLLGAITMGVAEEDLFLSLANRLIRLEKQITDKEKDRLVELSGGKNLKQITKELLVAYDFDEIETKAQIEIDKIPVADRTPALIEEAKKNAQQKLILEASKTFTGQLNTYLENVRKEHEQIIDSHNIDTVTKSEWETTSVDKAIEIVKDFTAYLEANKDEIKALSIFYNQPYNRREITFKMIKEVMMKLRMEKPLLAPDYVWEAYATLDASTGSASVNKQPKDELTALVSLIRKACGKDQKLTPYDKTIDDNFNKWIFKQHTGQHNRFSAEQLDWLRMIKEHVVSSYHIEIDDLDYTPFDAKGGKGKMHQLFGNEMNEIIEELNEVLAA